MAPITAVAPTSGESPKPRERPLSTRPPHHHLRRLAVAAAIVVAAASLATGSSAEARLTQPPPATVLVAGALGAGFAAEQLVVATDCADPSVTQAATGGYWMVCTSETIPAVPLLHSTDLVHWTRVSNALITAGNRPAWAVSSFWGPTLAEQGDGSWRLYVTSRNDAGTLEIAVGSAPAATGPWTFAEQPLVPGGSEGVIDPSVFTDTDGSRFLLWKVDGNHSGQRAQIRMQALAADGEALVGGTSRLLIVNDQPWEGAVVEAPVMVHRDGYYYLFYSGNGYRSDRYAIGVARSPSLDGPWEKHPGGPILSGNSAWSGPGGETIAVAPDGATVMLWHANLGPTYNGIREVLAGALGWNAAGWPMPAVSAVTVAAAPPSTAPGQLSF